ncbi:MAG: aldehyde dehydrogenase family protein [Candidatus Aminicenantes bacterium]|nr:aldehyde dehydrogenase family protein [Candidatus Aminicenantes bacterium]
MDERERFQTEKVQPVLLAGHFRQATFSETFQAYNPTTGEKLPEVYPVSCWSDLELALEESQRAVPELARTSPEKIAAFINLFADLLENNQERIIARAHLETALPVEPRLKSTEFPRMINQLRQAAAACKERSWCQATIDTKLNIRSKYGPLGGAVVIFSPNNFPLAFNSVAGSDFVSAIATGNPVICKAHPGHPGTTRLMAELLLEALSESGLPLSSVQMLYHFNNEDGFRLVSDHRVAAVAFTGSRKAGLKLKEAAEKAGKLFYAELSSVNPVFFLPGLLKEKSENLAGELFSSCSLGSGQFCTKPGLVVFINDEAGRNFLRNLQQVFSQPPSGFLLSLVVLENLKAAVESLKTAGAELLAGGHVLPGPGFRFEPTLFALTGAKFLENPETFQTEAFGTLTVAVVVEDAAEMVKVAKSLEGNLTGSIYCSHSEEDEEIYKKLEPVLRLKVGRLLNNKMPTGVAVSPAMHHGGPYPATGHPGFTSVGIPAAFLRFAARHCYDNVPEERLPEELRSKNPNGRMWRLVDGHWTQADF